MRVIALGTSAAYPGPDNACTGWLVEERGTRLLIDCGTGVLSKLQRFLPLTQLTSIVISHMHADHFLDLVPLRYAFRYGLKESRPRCTLYLPPGGRASLERMAAAFAAEESEDFFAAVFTLREYDPEGTLLLGPLAVRFAPGDHYIPAWGVAVEGQGKVVFTGDTGPSEAIVELAKGAHLLISEATYLTTEEEEGSRRGHLTAREAGELAARAQPQRLLLTHLWPHHDPHQVLAQAKAAFAGEVALAEPGRSYEV